MLKRRLLSLNTAVQCSASTALSLSRPLQRENKPLLLEMFSTWEMFCNDKKSNVNSEKVGLNLTKLKQTNLTKLSVRLDISSYSLIFCETKKPVLKTVAKLKQQVKPNCTHVHNRVKTLWSLHVWGYRAQYCLLLSLSVHIFSWACRCSASQYGIILPTVRCWYWGASCTASDSCIASFDRTDKLIM